MIFITGGAAQGKRRFAAERLGAKDIAECGEISPEELSAAECIADYQLLVKRLMKDGADPVLFTGKLLAAGKQRVIIMDEIGCGIVPIDREERLWRENAGRCGCLIAAAADTVIRMVCGVPCVIKGEL